MARTGKSDTLEQARKLMDDFARRTGLSVYEGEVTKRYLWTDAFAVQTFFALAHALKEDAYQQQALKLIEKVHAVLGRYSQHDSRQGWISELPEAEGKKHPAINGLRIGKRLPERKAEEPFNEQLEWERDGQYFHYITRWINALLQAQQETGEQHYAEWAAELIQAGGKFIHSSNGQIRMYWKMSVDLSRPLVPSMGAHDPLEGLICAKSASEAAPAKAQDLAPLIRVFEKLCSGKDWATTDALGIGGLLLNTARAAALAKTEEPLPAAATPEKLLADCSYGLKVFFHMYDARRSASQRLAFRECGLSLGLRVVLGLKEQLADAGLSMLDLDSYTTLADSIEEFWSKPENQQAGTWTDHQDINTVSLAASLIAHHYPYAFCATES